MNNNANRDQQDNSGHIPPTDNRPAMASSALKRIWSEHFKAIKSGKKGIFSNKSERKLSILEFLYKQDASIDDILGSIGTSYANIARCIQRMRDQGLVSIVNQDRRMCEKAIFRITDHGIERMKFLQNRFRQQ